MRKSNLIVALLLVFILGVCLVACGEEETVIFTVTFDTHGGSDVAPIIVEIGKEITLPENPTKEGYIFDGWYIDKDLLNEFVETQTIAENITLYAKWKENDSGTKPTPQSYTITFNSQGGSDVAPITIEAGNAITLPNNPTKEGYIFDGWYVDKELLNKFVATQTIAENITLYAKWNCDHTPVTDAAKDADCENTGLTEGSHCSKCNEVLVEQQIVPALGHKYGTVSYVWSADNKTCTASRTCANDASHVQTETATISATVSQTATCTQVELSTIAATFDVDWAETQTKINIQTGEKLSHTYSILQHSDTEHWYECSCGAEKPDSRALHSGGTAACYGKAECSVCREKYGELANHDYGEWVKEVPSTCTETGTKGHYECSSCHQYFDAENNLMSDWTIVKKAHTYKVVDDGIGAYKEPVNKSVVFGLYQANLGKWLFANGRMTSDDYFETVENFSSGLDVNIIHLGSGFCQFSPGGWGFINLYKDSNGHVGVEVDSSSNGFWEWNGEYNTYTYECDHETYFICATGQSTIASPVKAQDFEDNPSEYFVLQAVHTKLPQWTEGISATCAATGLKGHYECSECHKYFDAEHNAIDDLIIAIDNTAHIYGGWTGGYPTCISTGIKEHCECSVCHKNFDRDYNEIEDLTMAIDPNAHWYSEWIEVTSENCYDARTIGHYTCKNCHKNFDAEYNIIEDIELAPAKGHDYGDDGVCKTCGYFETGLEFELNEDGKSWSVVGIGTFSGTALVIPSVNYDTKPVTAIGEGALCWRENIKSVVIPDSINFIGAYAFRGCSGITSITLPNELEYIDFSAFDSCTSLTSITIPQSVTYIDEWVFSSCSSLESIVVDENNVIYHSAGNCLIETESKTLIYGCKNSIIPDDGSVTRIAAYSFFGSDIESITISNGVISIGNQAFCGCNKMTTISIPQSMGKIGYLGDGCAFTRIDYRGTIAQWNAITFVDGWDSSSGNYTIYCTDGTIAKDGTITYDLKEGMPLAEVKEALADVKNYEFLSFDGTIYCTWYYCESGYLYVYSIEGYTYYVAQFIENDIAYDVCVQSNDEGYEYLHNKYCNKGSEEFAKTQALVETHVQENLDVFYDAIESDDAEMSIEDGKLILTSTDEEDPWYYRVYGFNKTSFSLTESFPDYKEKANKVIELTEGMSLDEVKEELTFAVTYEVTYIDNEGHTRLYFAPDGMAYDQTRGVDEAMTTVYYANFIEDDKCYELQRDFTASEETSISYYWWTADNDTKDSVMSLAENYLNMLFQKVEDGRATMTIENGSLVIASIEGAEDEYSYSIHSFNGSGLLIDERFPDYKEKAIEYIEEQGD